MIKLEVREHTYGEGKDRRTIRYLFFPCLEEKECRRCYLDDTGNLYRCHQHYSTGTNPAADLMREAKKLLNH